MSFRFPITYRSIDQKYKSIKYIPFNIHINYFLYKRSNYSFNTYCSLYFICICLLYASINVYTLIACSGSSRCVKIRMELVVLQKSYEWKREAQLSFCFACSTSAHCALKLYWIFTTMLLASTTAYVHCTYTCMCICRCTFYLL